ncbi:hypothetical protein GFL49_14470 [Rhizobium leguminosarum bv. viciae]|nr:hypothetical protein [Rhizobium leguminosarum bv. viciae]
MIDPLTARPETPERKIELDQTVDFAIQLLVEEAHLVGWTDRNLQRHHHWRCGRLARRDVHEVQLGEAVVDPYRASLLTNKGRYSCKPSV